MSRHPVRKAEYGAIDRALGREPKPETLISNLTVAAGGTLSIVPDLGSVQSGFGDETSEVGHLLELP